MDDKKWREALDCLPTAGTRGLKIPKEYQKPQEESKKNVINI